MDVIYLFKFNLCDLCRPPALFICSIASTLALLYVLVLISALLRAGSTVTIILFNCSILQIFFSLHLWIEWEEGELIAKMGWEDIREKCSKEAIVRILDISRNHLPPPPLVSHPFLLLGILPLSQFMLNIYIYLLCIFAEHNFKNLKISILLVLAFSLC